MKTFHAPSVDLLISSVKTAASRFFYTYLSAVAATASFLTLVIFEESNNVLAKVGIIAVICFFAFLSAELFFEREKTPFTTLLVVKLIMCALAVGSYFLLPADFPDHSSYALIIKLVLSGWFFVIMVFLSPFLLHQEDNGFWHWSKNVGISILLSVIYTGILFAGLSVAVTGTNVLFELQLDEKIYLEMFITLTGLLGTLLVLSRLPQNLEDLDNQTETIARVRYFGQYVLLPLWLVYLGILYAYFVKVITTGDWPNGWVVYLITLFYFIGLVVHWFLFPFHQQFSWIRKLAKITFVLSLPLFGIYFWALSFRLADYGLTTNRYFVFALGVWMVGLSVYYLFAKSISLKKAFLGLALGILVVSIGPWSAFSLPKQLQYKQLEKILMNNGILVNDQIVKNTKNLPCEVSQQISDKVVYLSTKHDYNFSPLLGTYIEGYGYSYADIVLAKMGIENIYNCQDGMVSERIDSSNNSYFSFTALNPSNTSAVFSIKDYDYIVEVNGTNFDFYINDKMYNLSWGKDSSQLVLSHYKPDFKAVISLKSVADELSLNLKTRKQIPQGQIGIFFSDLKLQPVFSIPQISGRLIFEEISGHKVDEEIKFDYIRGKLLLKIK